jgi:aspartokinase
MAKHGVEGVYDADPSKVPDAKFIPEITHRQAIERGLRVMDSTALSLCMDNDLPICVFNLADEHNIERIISGERVGTIVSSNGKLDSPNMQPAADPAAPASGQGRTTGRPSGSLGAEEAAGKT